MSNASIPQDLLERILEYLPRDASLFLNFGHASRTCYALSSHDKHWKHCWAKRFADAQPQKNYKTTFIKLCKYLKKHPNDKPDAYEIKTVMVGNTGVGKTNMHVRYMNQCYLADLDTNKFILYKKFEVLVMAMDANVFQVGVSDHQAKNHFYVRETQNVFLLMFSLLDRQSFLDLEKWTDEIYQHTNATHGSLSIVLIGTKKDACTDQIVSGDEIKKFMRRWEINEYFETSAKTGENVDEAYTSVCEKLLFKRVKRYTNLITKWETGIDDKKCCLM